MVQALELWLEKKGTSRNKVMLNGAKIKPIAYVLLDSAYSVATMAALQIRSLIEGKCTNPVQDFFGYYTCRYSMGHLIPVI